MSHVFLSYSRADSALVDELGALLEREGYRVWIDRQKIIAGSQWRPELVKAIRECSIFILMLSPDSVRSRDVAKELTLAEEGKKPIVPVEIGTVEIPPHLQYHLAGTQRIKMTQDAGAFISTLLGAMVGAPERAEASAARFDRTMTDNDAELTATVWDANALQAKRSRLLAEMFRLDTEAMKLGHGTAENDKRREELLRQIDELSGDSKKKMDAARAMQAESWRQMAESSKKSED